MSSKTAYPHSRPRGVHLQMMGASNMQDWLMCEAEAGGFIRVTQAGYLIDPGFESCMRSKGYKPESEVAEQLRL